MQTGRLKSACTSAHSDLSTLFGMNSLCIRECKKLKVKTDVQTDFNIYSMHMASLPICTMPVIQLYSTSLGITIYSKQHTVYNDDNVGIKHGFSCINICQVPREVFSTTPEGPGKR